MYHHFRLGLTTSRQVPLVTIPLSPTDLTFSRTIIQTYNTAHEEIITKTEPHNQHAH